MPRARSWSSATSKRSPTTEFSPTYLRAGTAYGMSAKLRGDLVVNNLIGFAVTTGQVLIKSDGMSVAALVHVEDIAAAYQAVLEAPREQVHDQAFNVGATAENYRVMRRSASWSRRWCRAPAITFAGGASPDKRNYRVNCDKLMRSGAELSPELDVAAGDRADLRRLSRPGADRGGVPRAPLLAAAAPEGP